MTLQLLTFKLAEINLNADRNQRFQKRMSVKNFKEIHQFFQELDCMCKVTIYNRYNCK